MLHDTVIHVAIFGRTHLFRSPFEVSRNVPIICTLDFEFRRLGCEKIISWRFYPISTKLEFSKLPFLYEQLPLSYEQLPLSSNQTTTFILIDFIPVLVLRWMFRTRFVRNESYSIIMWWFRTKLPVPKPFQQIVAKLGYNIPQDILNLVSWIHIINKNLAPLPHPI